MKRGEISMEVIIIAAISLLVLVILSVLIIRSGGTVAKDCQNVGGECVPGSITDGDQVCGDGKIRSPNNCGEGNVCCITLNKE